MLKLRFDYFMSTETPDTGSIVTQGLMDLGVVLPGQKKPELPAELPLLLTAQPKDGTFPLFLRIEQTQPAQAFLVLRTFENPNLAELSENTELSFPPKIARAEILAVVIVKAPEKELIPTKEDFKALRDINSLGKLPGNAVLVLPRIHTSLVTRIQDLELLLVREQRGKNRPSAEVMQQAADETSLKRMYDRFHAQWNFKLVQGAKLTPEQARNDIRKFLHVTA